MAEHLFTVNAEGKKVIFSPANIYWNGTEFKFEEHQYDYPAEWNPNHVGHFFWSKDAGIARAEVYNDQEASVTDKFFASDGGAIDGWTVLSKDEWQYLIDNAIAKNQATIDGKKCTVLKPDGFNGTVADTYTASEWAEAEKDGLVALPFTGTRDDSDIYGTDHGGGCWSSTPYEDDDRYACYAYFSYDVANMYDDARDYGFSVRLAQEYVERRLFHKGLVATLRDWINGKLAGKQNTISDLSIIRTGATAGATALPKVESIEEKISPQATKFNKLVDRDFVNSSIATNTATFRGTYRAGNFVALDALKASALQIGKRVLRSRSLSFKSKGFTPNDNGSLILNDIITEILEDDTEKKTYKFTLERQSLDDEPEDIEVVTLDGEGSYDDTRFTGIKIHIGTEWVESAGLSSEYYGGLGICVDDFLEDDLRWMGFYSEKEAQYGYGTFIADDNDYLFVDTEDAEGNRMFNRYKYSEEGMYERNSYWLYEYTLNNSSFTEEQWAALNSGITAGKVAQIGEKEIVYVTTENTYEEVLALINDGKYVILADGYYMPLVYAFEGKFLFGAVIDGTFYVGFVVDSGGWSAPIVYYYEKTSNKVTSINSSSTNEQYPSAKCVYDLIGNVESLLNSLL